MDLGAWEGQACTALLRNDLDAWTKDLLHARPYGGETVAKRATLTGAALAEAGQGPVRAQIVTDAGVTEAAVVRRDGPAGWDAQIGLGTGQLFDAKAVGCATSFPAGLPVVLKETP